jgi:hypothetical protein
MYVNGVSQGHLTGIRVVDYDGVCPPTHPNSRVVDGVLQPIMDVTSNGMSKLVFGLLSPT